LLGVCIFFIYLTFSDFLEPPEVVTNGVNNELTAEDMKIIDEFLDMEGPKCTEVENTSMSVVNDSAVGVEVLPPLQPPQFQLPATSQTKGSLQHKWTFYNCPEPHCGYKCRRIDAFERHKAEHISGYGSKNAGELVVSFVNIFV